MDKTDKTNNNKKTTGKKYEDIAKRFLEFCGYTVLEQNFQTRTGEIDIIGKENGVLSFVEVKYRKNLSCGFPSEAVNIKKQQKIINTAKYYLLINGIKDAEIRFDVVEIVGDKIRVIRNAFGE